LDCDLQDRPEDIQKLLTALGEGNGIAVAKSSFRGKRGIRRNVPRVLYYKLLDVLTGTRKGSTHSTGSFFALSVPARDAFNTYPERRRHVSAIVRDIGFSMKYVPVEHEEIINNPSSYSTRDRINLAFDGAILNGVRVLKYAVVLSLLLFTVTFLALGFVIFAKITNFQSLPGWLSTIAFLLLVVSIQFLTIGIVGIYLSEVLTEVRARPGYVIEDIT
jgi:dolichol-phosphate mannosyltransferase